MPWDWTTAQGRREYHREWRRRNKDKIAARMQVNKEKIKARLRLYRLAHIEKFREYDRQRHLANKERDNEYARRYREANREKVKGWFKEYYKNNPELWLLVNAKHAAKRRGLEFSIDKEDIHIPNVCPLLGIPLIKKAIARRIDNSASVDRIDNSRGYVSGNVWVISWKANLMKTAASLLELDAFCENWLKIRKEL